MAKAPKKAKAAPAPVAPAPAPAPVAPAPAPAAQHRVVVAVDKARRSGVTYATNVKRYGG